MTNVVEIVKGSADKNLLDPRGLTICMCAIEVYGRDDSQGTPETKCQFVRIFIESDSLGGWKNIDLM
jgi:hypothetical protein